VSYPEPHLGFTQWQLAEKIARAKREKSKHQETEPKNAAALQPSWCWSGQKTSRCAKAARVQALWYS
jgi:hypothetical protein